MAIYGIDVCIKYFRALLMLICNINVLSIKNATFNEDKLVIYGW